MAKDDEKFSEELFIGLRALAESAFPKSCASCGRMFETAEQFLTETQHVSGDQSGVKQSYDDDENVIVEVFRNCPCGSTLMDFFSSRRDMSSAGIRRRERFQQLLDYLVLQGLDVNIARAELLKTMRGETSEILRKFKPPRANKA